MKATINTNFKSNEERSKFYTLHEEWIKTLLAISKNAENFDEDAFDTLFVCSMKWRVIMVLPKVKLGVKMAI